MENRLPPKQKAEELIDMFIPYADSPKACALKAVGEMKKIRDELYVLAKVFLPNSWEKSTYLEEVEQEINNLIN